jgi:hypothetical protein
MTHMKLAVITTLGLATTLCLGALPASAQSPVSIRFEDGYVTLSARNAPLRTVLAEWARVGGSKIINGDRVTGNPVTLEINHEPERKALATLLRNVSGYVAASRAVTTSGASSLDRIHILPTPPPVQTAAATTPRPAAAPTPVVRFFPGETNDPNDETVILPNGVTARPIQLPAAQSSPAPVSAPETTVGMPTVTIPRAQEDQPERPTGPTTTPSFPGAASSGRPGEITPVNQQPRRPEDSR